MVDLDEPGLELGVQHHVDAQHLAAAKDLSLWRDKLLNLNQAEYNQYPTLKFGERVLRSVRSAVGSAQRSSNTCVGRCSETLHILGTPYIPTTSDSVAVGTLRGPQSSAGARRRRRRRR